MKQILLLLIFSAALTVSSCKKCWNCGLKVDGNDYKVCDKAEMERIEATAFSDINGNVHYVKCY